MDSYLLGIISAMGCYGDYGLTVWAPKEHSILLDYLKETFGGEISKRKSDKYQWIKELELGSEFLIWLEGSMPQQEGRNKLFRHIKEMKKAHKKVKTRDETSLHREAEEVNEDDSDYLGD